MENLEFSVFSYKINYIQQTIWLLLYKKKTARISTIAGQ